MVKRNIILTGFMGTGKSSVGRLVAERLGRTFIDIDQVIEEETGLSIPDIFRDLGEPYFRELERRAIREVIRKRGLVVATGGGAIVDPENLRLLKGAGLLICLTASPEAIYERVKGDRRRPLLAPGDKLMVIKRLMKEREEFYRKADVIIDTTSKGLEAVAEEVIDAFERTFHLSIEVRLDDRSYPIYFFSDGFDRIGTVLRQHGLHWRMALVTNPVVRGLYGDRVMEGLREAGFDPFFVEIPDGERYKTLRWVSRIYDRLLEREMTREAPLVALGGGVIGDITGFAAATFLRGVPYVQIPTTLLAQVDSSVGGKTGVNHPRGKNLIGAFYQPKLVFIDVGFLKTLKKRELKAGLAEVIKYGIIRDRGLFSYLEENMERILDLEEEPLLHIVKRSCEIKARIVEEDEREKGIRAILNLGHTFGHAIESVTRYRRFRHGEAVAIGMVLATRLSERLGLCERGVTERIERLLLRAGLPVKVPSSITADSLLESMKLDKKRLKEEMVRLILVRDIGDVVIRERGLRDFSLDLMGILK